MQLRHHDFLLSTGMLNLAVSSGDCVNFTLGFRQDREMKVENGKITLTPKKNENTHFTFTAMETRKKVSV